MKGIGLVEKLSDQEKAEFDRTTAIREMVNGIMGGAVVVAREPLTREQGERLVDVMARASAQYQRGGRASSGDLDWERIDAAARTFLSEGQFAYFKTMEPPLPLGARHQAQFYRTVEEAKRKEIADSASARTNVSPPL